MSESVLYVYAITRDPAVPRVSAIDDSEQFGSVSRAGVSAVYTAVPTTEFSQEAIDARAADLEWLGAIGYRHQAVVADLMEQTPIVPLRAFTLFSGTAALEQYLGDHSAALRKALDRLDGKREWTLRIEFEPEKWNAALVHRAQSLRDLAAQIETAPPGKAFLLKKKLEDERKRASREAEADLVAEIEHAVIERLKCETVAESRQLRDGAFPQIDVLINRDEEAILEELQRDLTDRYAAEGVTLSVTGPWPPYTFASGVADA